MALTYTFANRIINYFTRNQADTQPTSIQVALFTANPTASMASGPAPLANEVNGGSYARQTVLPAGIPAPVNGVTQNSGNITFPVATANWGTVTHAAILDNNNNSMMFGPLAVSKTVSTGDQFTIPLNDLIMQLA